MDNANGDIDSEDGRISREEARNRSVFTSVKCIRGLLDEYCKFSTLHGLRYIRDSSLPRIERVFWLGIFLTCLFASGIIVKDAYCQQTDCCTLFEPILTNAGLCYVFNSLPGEIVIKHYRPLSENKLFYDDDIIYWGLEKGYPQRAVRGDDVRPYWVRVRGEFFGLTFDLVDHREEAQQICSMDSGFKVFVLPPDGFPETESYMRIPTGVHTQFKLIPNFITANESLRSVPVDDRECLFQNESLLEFFNYYSQSACQVECYTKTTLRHCGCVPTNLHRIVGEFGYPYCNDSSNKCLATIFNTILVSKSKGRFSFLEECTCFPGCFWMSYDFDVSFQKLIGQPPNSNVARLSIYFSIDQFNTITRLRTSDVGVTLSNVGGLLGLLFGFSFISFFEVVYYGLFRPIKQFIIVSTVYAYRSLISVGGIQN
ncbi:pickpocket protein 28-like [Macrosteles quadrilineatus]|uniref:pickpocket protein 28-like n=1 Tax=Macrosteles quadrilineatus TaxID=74068 RepID=UPI0023E22B47|nr:pickpocket protein 28-like [Macrosteles quadrilineatus]